MKPPAPYAPTGSPGRSLLPAPTRCTVAGIAAALLITSFGVARAVTVEPGSTEPLEAEGCTTASGSATGDCLLGCNADCVESSNMARAFVDVTNYTAGKKFAEATAYTEFTVSAGGSGSATNLDANISYDVEWTGGWTVKGAFTGWNDGASIVTLTLTDRTDGGRVVRSVELHRMNVDGFIGIDLIDVGFGLDEGSTTNSFSARLTRGHEYRLGLKVRCEAKGALNATITLDYFAGNWGVRWNELTVALAPDLNEEIERLKRRLDALEEHTHTYRTGRGEGHNNTEAQTSAPVLAEVDTLTDDEEQRIGSLRDARAPLPQPLIFDRNTRNPVMGGGAIVRFTLPEPDFVRLELFSVDGRLARTLLSESRGAGENEFHFDSAGLAPGIYYFRLSSSRFVEARKLTLLR